MKSGFLISLLILAAGPLQAEAWDASDYARSIATWQQEREDALKGANGWLNLAGLHWLAPGETSVGSDSGNDIVLTPDQAPPKLGVFTLEDDFVTFEAESGVAVYADGVPVTQLPLSDDADDAPTRLRHATLQWHIIRRMERVGVRLRDFTHPAVAEFKGNEYYPVDAAWRLEAKFAAYTQPRIPMLTTVVEELGWAPTAPGVLEFVLDGEAHTLEAYDVGDRFFVIFADLTTGETAYPSGRYLYAEKPDRTGSTVLDFNLAHSPPCAFTDYATCPLPSRQNRLGVAVEAGEKY